MHVVLFWSSNITTTGSFYVALVSILTQEEARVTFLKFLTN